MPLTREVSAMKAVVVFESHWGNTAAVARAIAEGIGPEAQALTTDEASPAVLADADLLIAGAPVIAFRLPSEGMLESIRRDAPRDQVPPDVSHPSMRAWLEALPRGHGRSAAFETRMRWSPGGATGAITHGLEGAGYSSLAKAQRFVVTSRYGPLRDGELDRARAWGAELARAIGEPARSA
jgi:hypothetical protein